MRTVFTAVVSTLFLAASAFAQAPQPVEPQKTERTPAPAAERAQPGPWSADRLMDTKIRSREGEEIGEIEDLLVDDNGKIASVVVEVGGFLGIGEKHVLLPFQDLELTRDGEGNVLLKSNADKAKFETAPEYKND
jgi:hypothetical protein